MWETKLEPDAEDPETRVDYLARVSTEGALEWGRQRENPSEQHDYATDIEIGDDGTIDLTGTLNGHG